MNALPPWLLYLLAGAGALAVLLVAAVITLLVFILVLARVNLARQERRERELAQLAATMRPPVSTATAGSMTRHGAVDTPPAAKNTTPSATNAPAV